VQLGEILTVGGLSLILSEAPAIIVVAMMSAIVSPCVVVGKVLFVRVSNLEVSRYQSIVESEYRSALVKIRARLFVSFDFC
jgi:hypothetical protein